MSNVAYFKPKKRVYPNLVGIRTTLSGDAQKNWIMKMPAAVAPNTSRGVVPQPPLAPLMVVSFENSIPGVRVVVLGV
jgi:hypothetical protein